jgi:replicative DNA helicase
MVTQVAHRSVEYEQIVLGAAMTDPAIIDALADIGVTAATFCRPMHVTIYQAILAAVDAGTPVEPHALASRLADSGDLGRIGGAPYLHTLIASVPTAANGTWYAGELVTLQRWRELDAKKIRITQLVDAGRAGGHTVDDVVDLARQSLDELTIRPGSDDPVVWADLVDAGLAAIEEADTQEGSAQRIPTGFIDLDRLLGGGMADGQLVIVAGRTSMGKSVVSRGFLANAAFNLKSPAVLFSLEMTRQEVFECLLSAHARVPLHLIREGKLSDADWTRIARWVGESSDAPLYVDDSATITLAEIRAKCRRLKSRLGALGLVVVDYIQLMASPKRVENRQQEVAELSRGLKLLAKELECPVVAVAQLNRGPEQRADKRPMLADLRESGSIENDANVVILVYREDYYDPDSPRKGEADLIVAKNRGGPKDTVTVAAQLHLARFVDMAVA